jgi:Leucine-rich repeat (LRR) protein
MCILCNGNLDYSITELDICNNIDEIEITEIPKEFTQLIRLDCSHTEITEIPKEFTNLTELVCHNTNITEIPREFTQLTWLNCSYTEITEIPKEFTNLTELDCSNTNITEIPKEFAQLTQLYCSYTKITEIPKEFTKLTYLNCSNTKITEIPKKINWLYCHNCPNLVKVPEKFKKEYIKEYNFLQVPVLSRLIFNKYKRSYSENIRLQLEIKFNEVYYAPTGKGALELFKKYEIRNNLEEI